MKKISMLFVLLWSMASANTIEANVLAVQANGSKGAYRFAVTVKSTETGCEQYADWWEVLSVDGTLLYRRILVHSHPTTQPFTRSGSTVDINKYDTVYVRAHMNKEGYVGQVMVGSVAKGFEKMKSGKEFSKAIETQAPLPTGCLF